MAATSTALHNFPRTELPDMAVGPVARGIILDRTAWFRLGLRGPGTPAWCDAVGLPFPERINTVAHGQGCRVTLRVPLNCWSCPTAAWGPCPTSRPDCPGVFDGYRDESWAWLRLDGPHWRNLLAGLTSADLRPGSAMPGSVLQTRLASLDVVLLIDDDAAVDIFGDIASAHFLAALPEEA